MVGTLAQASITAALVFLTAVYIMHTGEQARIMRDTFEGQFRPRPWVWLDRTEPTKYEREEKGVSVELAQWCLLNEGGGTMFRVDAMAMWGPWEERLEGHRMFSEPRYPLSKSEPGKLGRGFDVLQRNHDDVIFHGERRWFWTTHMAAAAPDPTTSADPREILRRTPVEPGYVLRLLYVGSDRDGLRTRCWVLSGDDRDPDNVEVIEIRRPEEQKGPKCPHVRVDCEAWANGHCSYYANSSAGGDA